jgi:hypothetical protein
MRSTVRLSFGPVEVLCHVPADHGTMGVEDARRWLDDQFIARDCEPLRPMGKVLTGDKLVALAQAIGAAGFQADAPLRTAFALAASTVLASDDVHIDVDTHKLSY